jgi:hypothetical protein
MTASPAKSGVLYRVLTLIGMALLAASYLSPIWWVALTAPQYPPNEFPDGVRIEFHFTGVANGCHTHARQEVEQGEELD